MHGRRSADGHAILHGYMSGQQHVIDERHLVSNLTVVTDMRPAEQKAAVPHHRFRIRNRTPVNGCVVANDAALPDPSITPLAMIHNILWSVAEDDVGVKFAIPSDRGPPGNVNAVEQAAARADFHVSVDDAEWAHVRRGLNFRPRINNGGGMNQRAPPSMSKVTCFSSELPATRRQKQRLQAGSLL